MDNEKFYTVRGYQLISKQKDTLTPSLEDYLEMIYRDIMEIGYIRVNKLSNDLHVKPSSVSKMIAKLSSLGFIDYEKYGVIKLTPLGEQTGKYLLQRHNIIFKFFNIILNNDIRKAFIETELIEHTLSKETVNKLGKLVSFLNNEEIFAKFQRFKN